MHPSDWIALAAVGVSGLAVIFTWLGARSSNKAQERTSQAAIDAQKRGAADERVWQRRADTYVDMMDWARSTFAAIARDQPLEDIPIRLAARVDTFAHDYVADLFQRAAAETVKLRTARKNGELQDAQPARLALARIQAAVRADLGTTLRQATPGPDELRPPSPAEPPPEPAP